MLPIVLVHGIARFDILLEIERKKIGLPDGAFDGTQYFRNIKTQLESSGFGPVFHTNEDFAGPVELRAAQLKGTVEDVLTSTGESAVHIIAHSMGGLDARHMIVDLNMADKVSSLTTIGTPHSGTPLATHVIENGGRFWIDILKNVIDLEGFADLMVSRCELFNHRAEDSEARNGVLYQTYSSSEQLDRIFLPLVPSFVFLSRTGENDGLVPVNSQQWTTELSSANGIRKQIRQRRFPFPADHLNEIGWWDPNEAINPLVAGSFDEQRAAYENKVKDVYLQIARDL